MAAYPKNWSTATIRIYEVEKLLLAFAEQFDKYDKMEISAHSALGTMRGIRRETKGVLERWGPRLHPIDGEEKP